MGIRELSQRLLGKRRKRRASEIAKRRSRRHLVETLERRDLLAGVQDDTHAPVATEVAGAYATDHVAIALKTPVEFSDDAKLDAFLASQQWPVGIGNATNSFDFDYSFTPSNLGYPVTVGSFQVVDGTDLVSMAKDAQVVYLSLDGTSDVDYRGPINVEDIDVPSFVARGHLAGQEATVLRALNEALAEDSAGSSLIFTNQQPQAGEFSVVHIGGNADSFSQWGQFYGLAEQIDTGNQDQSDSAFVFTDQIPSDGLTADAYGRRLAGVVLHEVGHLLGTPHEYPDTDAPLSSVAFDPKVHVSIGTDAASDAADDGQVTINGQEYAVHPLIVVALSNQRPYYNAGAVAGDGFPDVLMGQFAIHPIAHGTWLTRVLDMAWKAQEEPTSVWTATEKSQILAWSYGFLTHSAADHFAHTLVNSFAEGVAPGFGKAAASLPTDQRDLGNMLRHFMTEAYIADSLPGFDANKAVRTEVDSGSGDFTDDDTPGIEYEAPIRFIYETLLRAFPDDPTPVVEMDWEDGTLIASAAADAFTSAEGSFADDGFKVGHKITVSGFTNAANNGPMFVTAVTSTTLTVSGSLVDETASGDESIIVRIAKTEPISITADASTNRLTRSDPGGNFQTDGFVPGMRFDALGMTTNARTYVVKSVTPTTITVVGGITSGPGTFSELLNEGPVADVQLVVLGQRGPGLDKIFQLRDALLNKAVQFGARGDTNELATFASDLIEKLVIDEPINDALKQSLFRAYLYNWIDEIDEGVRHWGELGLAFTRAVFDSGSRRDLQQKIGEATGFPDSDDPTTIRSKAEDGVGILGVLVAELDDLNGDGSTFDSFINRHLMPMAGLPAELGLLRGGLQAFGDEVGELLQPVDVLFNPIKASVNDAKTYVKDYVKEQIKERYGFDFEVFDFLKGLGNKMDLASVSIGSTEIPIFKPGDHERLDEILGLPPNHHQGPVPIGIGLIPGIDFDFYPGAQAGLADNAELDKELFAAYANSVTLTKLMYLMEADPLSNSLYASANGQLSDLYSDILTNLNGTTTEYDFGNLNLHGGHGGNVLTTTLPGAPGSAEGLPWMTSIDADQVWRANNYTINNSLFRVSTSKAPSPVVYQATGLTPGEYKVYGSWQANVTQDLDNLQDSDYPDQKIAPTQFAQYSVFDDTDELGIYQKDQRVFADDVEHQGLAFEQIGASESTTFTITSGTLKVTLGKIANEAKHVIAGPILIERVSDGVKFRIQNNRDPQTLQPIATPGFTYTDDPAFWTDMVYVAGGDDNVVYHGSGGNNPLWESSQLRPVFRELFSDWNNNGQNFPDLGDVTTLDLNDAVGKVERASHATAFGPILPDQTLQIPIPDSLKNAILDGLAGLVSFGEAIDSLPPLQLEIPGINKSLSELIDVSGAMDSKIRQPIVDYFTNDATPTFKELFAVLPASLGTWGAADGSTFEFDVDLRQVFAASDVPFSLGDDASGLKLDSTVDVGSSVSFVDSATHALPLFSFGIDLSSAQDATDRFYLRAETLLIHAEASAANLDMGGEIGFLAIGVEDGSVDIEADIEVLLIDPSGSDGRITLGDLAETSLSDLTNVSLAGSFTADLPIVASIGSSDMTATAHFSDSDLFDSAAPDVTLQGFDDLLAFDSFDIGSIINALGTFDEAIARLADSSLLDIDIPFVNANAGDLLDSTLSLADRLRDAEGQPTVRTIQELTIELASLLGVDATAIGLDFDPASKELSLHVDVNETFATDLISFNPSFDLGPVTLSSNGNLSVDADLDTTFDLVVLVDPVAAVIEATSAPNLNFTGTATFEISAGATEGTTVQFSPSGTLTLADLVVELQAALDAAGLADLVIAGERNGKLTLTSGDAAASSLFLSAVVTDPAVTDLGLPDSSLAIDSVAAHSYVENVQLEANFALSGQISGNATVGPVGLDGTLAGSGSMSVGLNIANGQRVQISELVSDVFENPAGIVTPQISGDLQVDVADLQVRGGFELNIPSPTGASQIQVILPDLSNPQVQVTYDNALIGDLLSFEDFTLDDFLSVLDTLAESLIGIGKNDLLALKIPVLGVSAGDILDLATEVRDLVAELRAQGTQQFLLENLEQRLVNAFGIPVDQLQLLVSGSDLILDLDWQTSVTTAFDLNLDLESLGLPVVGSLLSVDSDDTIDVAAGATFNLVVGIETGVGTLPRPYLRGDSGLTLTAEVFGDDIDVDITALKVLPLFIRDGKIILDSDGVDGGADGMPDNSPAQFTVDVNGEAADKEYLLTLAGAPRIPQFTVDLDAGVNVELPLFFPTETSPLDDGDPNTTHALHVSVPDLEPLLGGDFSGVVEVNVPDFAAAASNLGIGDGLRVILAGIQRLFPGIANKVQSVFDTPIPLVGKSLANLSNFDIVGSFLPALQSGLEAEFASNLAPTATAIETVMNDALAGYLTSPVTISVNTSDEVVFDLHLGKQVDSTLPIDLGVPALGFEIDADVDVSFGWSIDLGIGVSTSDGFFVEVAAGDELHVDLDVGFASGSSVKGTLGFLQVDLTDTNGETQLSGDLGVNLVPVGAGTRIKILDLVSRDGGIGEMIDASLSFDATAGFEAELSAAFGGGVIPSILADFDASWSLGNAIPSSAGFTNIRVDVGEVFSRFGGKVFETIGDVLEPLEPLLKVLNTRLPILSDVSLLRNLLDDDRDGRVTILDAAKAVGSVDAGFIDSLEFVVNIVDKLNTVTDAASAAGGALFIPLPDFVLAGEDLVSANGLDDFVIPAQIFDLNSALDALNNSAVKDAVQQFQTASAGAPAKTQFSIPILDDPASVFSLFLGRDVPLLALDLAPLKVGFGVEQFFPILGPLGLRIEGRIEAEADLAFGFDTYGIRQFANANFSPGSVAVLLEGFYAYDRVDKDGNPSFTGEDVDEIQITGTIFASGSVDVGIISGDGGGFIEGVLGLNLNDADGDGRARPSELLDCPFDAHGELNAGLFAKIKFGYKWFSVTKRYTLAEVTLLEFDGSCGPNETDNLASLSGGTLELNVGNVSGFGSNTTHLDETMRVSLEEDDAGETVYRVWSGKRFQDFDFDSVQRIEGIAEGGEDRITIDADIVVPALLDGGDGDDVLSGGNGPNELIGGDGDDEIYGGPEIDIITGGDGNDLISGRGGADTIDGGVGNDDINAGDGDDLVTGGDGDDKITGGGGNDSISGGGGNDELDGGSGNDLIQGFIGNDSIAGGAGNDELRGGLGSDDIVGGGGDDTLYGHGHDSVADDNVFDRLRGDSDPIAQGSELPEDARDSLPGDDTIYGGGGGDSIFGDDGDDQLFGEAGDDVIRGGKGNDTILAAAGNDQVYGESGDDAIQGNDGNDYLHGGSGQDTIYGHNLTGSGDDAAADIIRGGSGNDFIAGQAGDDELHGGRGDDSVDGGTGDDDLYGDAGDDELLGRDGDDTVWAGTGDDTVFGHGGNDVLYGNADSDFIEGGLGSDLIFGGAGVDFLYGHAVDDADDDNASDVIYGDQGIGHMFADITTFLFGGRDVILGQGGDDQLFGEQGRDDLFGNAGNDTIDGGAGADLIEGGEGDDTATGGDGDDEIYGQIGDDNLSGGAGNDRIRGGFGNDVIDGQAGQDVLLGQAGTDTIRGGDGNDQIDGGAGEDDLMGDDGDDWLFAGTGVVNVLRGGAGDDHLIGSDWGADDPDFADSVWFGDRLFGDSGNDRIEGRGGADVIDGGVGDDFADGGAAGDQVLGGDGNDTLYGGVGDDLIEGNVGNDNLYGEVGADVIAGGDGADFIDGGYDTDQLDGGLGDDHIRGGGGVGDVIVGGFGADRLEGSNDGADIIDAGPGDDWLQGHGGNDTLIAGGGDDRVEGGTGDDLIEGGAGSDILVGGTHHDVLYGHSADGIGDDAAVDFLYGDLGDTAITAALGKDQLFGGGGSDLLFGEAHDDFIDPGTGAEDRIDYGTGESGDPAGFVPPTPTPPPTLDPVLPAARTAATLPTGPVQAGRWHGLGDSAVGAGISGRSAQDASPSLTIDASGNHVVAWSDNRNGNSEIFVSRYAGGGWNELGKSASAGGVSQSLTPSSHPQIIHSASGQPIVAWLEGEVGNADVKLAAYDSISETWLSLDDSLTPGGISNTANVIEVVASESTAGPVVAWVSQTATTREIHVQVFDGTNWQALGAAVAATGDGVAELVLATGGETAIVWTDDSGSSRDVFGLQLVGTNWQAIAGSDSGGGISNTDAEVASPTVAWHDGNPIVAWQQVDQSEIGSRSSIVVKQLEGSAWAAVSVNTVEQDVTNRFASASKPQFTSGGELDLIWVETLDEPDQAKSDTVYRMRYAGGQFDEPFVGSSDAVQTGVLSQTQSPGTFISSLAVASDASGNPAIVWTAQSAASNELPAIYVRSEGPAAVNRYRVAGAAQLQSLLDGGDLVAGDSISLAAGNYSGEINIGASVSDLTIESEPKTIIHGTITIAGASNVSLQDLNVNVISILSGTNITLRDSVVQQLAISGGTSHSITGNRIESTGTAINVAGNAQAAIQFNKISGKIGVHFAAAASIDLRENQIAGTSIGIHLAADNAGTIVGNDVQSVVIGILYQADADFSVNTIHQSPVGVQVGPALAAGETVTFGGAIGSTPNTIRDNVVGVDVRDQVVGQHLIANQTGAIGNGQLGNVNSQQPNLIELSEVGSLVTGTVQYNQFIDNVIGIESFDKQLISHNTVSSLRENDSSIGIRVSEAIDSRIVHNTIVMDSGIAVKIEDASSEIELRSNVLWSESSTVIHVDDDSQSGFASDYNVLHSGPDGTLVHYSLDFHDILDWQEDVARFDLHSRGTTRLAADGARPRFTSIAQGNFTLAPLLARLSKSSPAVDAGDSRTDIALPENAAQNLLANVDFADSLTVWTTNVEATTGGTAASSFVGDNHFLAGATPLAFLEQEIDLIGSGYAASELDSLDLRVVFGGRVRHAQAESLGFSRITLTPLDSGSQPIGDVVIAEATHSADGRWELVGGEIDLPIGTRSLRYRYEGSRLAGSGSNSAQFDNAFLRMVSDTRAADVGAYGLTEHDLDTSGVRPTLHLRYPDLYTDWQRGQPRDILWDSYGNMADEPVEIVLLQDTATGPEVIRTIAATTADDGSFTWFPEASDVDFGTDGLRIEVRFPNQLQVLDRSVEAFSVPLDTNTYYVNDGFTGDDQYTIAIGDNRNTGKTPSDPKPIPTTY